MFTTKAAPLWSSVEMCAPHSLRWRCWRISVSKYSYFLIFMQWCFPKTKNYINRRLRTKHALSLTQWLEFLKIPQQPQQLQQQHHRYQHTLWRLALSLCMHTRASRLLWLRPIDVWLMMRKRATIVVERNIYEIIQKDAVLWTSNRAIPSTVASARGMCVKLPNNRRIRPLQWVGHFGPHSSDHAAQPEFVEEPMQPNIL